MNYRLIIFSVALLFLPPLALTLAGREWEAPLPVEGAVWLPTLLGVLAVSAFALLLDTLAFRRGSHSLLHSQRSYLLWCGVAGMLACMLLAYLNLFAGAWFTPASDAATLLLAALDGMALLPAVLITRLWLGGLPGLVKVGTRRLALPTPSDELAARLLLFAALAGLLAGSLWIYTLGWLFWLAPLLLLVALQLLWHESTIFSGLEQGDWSRVLLGALAGILVLGIALASYRASGGTIYLVSGTWQMLVGFALFGLLCLQIGDIVAEHWRGKPRGEVFKKKAFPIPVVSKKDQ